MNTLQVRRLAGLLLILVPVAFTICFTLLQMQFEYLGLTQTTDLLPFVGYFSPCGAKNNLQKMKSTMLPQAESLLRKP